jgi:hypothetical protein
MNFYDESEQSESIYGLDDDSQLTMNDGDGYLPLPTMNFAPERSRQAGARRNFESDDDGLGFLPLPSTA